LDIGFGVGEICCVGDICFDKS